MIKFVDEADLTTVGNAIRAKTGGSGLLTFPAGMAAAIAGIEAGADLPTLTNPAGAGDMASGKQGIGQDGGVVTGSVPTPNSVTLEDGTVEAGVTIDGSSMFLASGTMAADNLLRAGKTVQVSVAASAFGNANAADVASGKTFTSAAGLEATGTMPIIEGKIITLNCGQIHTIPAGCHSGSGRVRAASLGSQTAGTAAANDIASGKTAWVNGVKVTGTMAKITTATQVMNITVDEVIQGYADRTGTYTCPDGYMPFNLSTNCTTATLAMTDYNYSMHKLTYTMVWYGSATEDVEVTISLIKCDVWHP